MGIVAYGAVHFVGALVFVVAWQGAQIKTVTNNYRRDIGALPYNMLYTVNTKTFGSLNIKTLIENLCACILNIFELSYYPVLGIVRKVSKRK